MAKAAQEPIARRLYADGLTLAEISSQLVVSVVSLSKWKNATKDPGTGIDEWDKARSQKRGNIQRLRDLFNEQLEHLEGLRPEERTSPMMDTLSKLGALLERWDKMEKAQKVAADVVREVQKAGLTDTAVDSIRRSILGIGE